MELPADQEAASASLELPVYVVHESELPAVEGCQWESGDEQLVLASFEGLRESSGGNAAAAALHAARADQCAVLRVLGLETDTPLAQLVRVGDAHELLGASAVFRGHQEPIAGGTPLIFARTDSSDAPLALLGAASSQLQFTRVLLVPKQTEEIPASTHPNAAAHSSASS